MVVASDHAVQSVRLSTARTVDAYGRSQPMIVPGWNPRGYLNNACHRIAVRAI